MCQTNRLSSSIITEEHHIALATPLRVVQVNKKTQQNTDDLLQFDPEAFLNMVADMSDKDLMHYLEREGSNEMNNKNLQVSHYLLRFWKTKDSTYRNEIGHFVSNFLCCVGYYIQKENYEGAVTLMRFTVALSRHDNMTPIFLDSQERANRKDYDSARWFEAHKERLGIQ